MKKKIIVTLVILLIPTMIVVVSLYSSGVSQKESIDWVKSNNGDVEFHIKGWAESIPHEETKNLVGKQVTSVSLRDSKIEGLYRLEDFTDCEVLKIEGCTIDNFSTISKLKKIKELHFVDTNLKDLSFLLEFENLEYLELTNTEVADLKALEELQTLKTVKLTGSAVEDILPLTKLEQIEVIDLSETKVENILPLQKLKNLKNLHVVNTKVTKKQINYLTQVLQNCEITSTDNL